MSNLYDKVSTTQNADLTAFPTEWSGSQSGLSKREYMATKIAASLLTNPPHHDADYFSVIRKAVELADLLLSTLYTTRPTGDKRKSSTNYDD